MMRLMISLSITQQYGFQKIMDFIKTDQFYSLQFLTALLKPISQVKLQPLQPFLKHKRGELMRYLGPLRILQNAQNHTYQNSFQARNLTNYVKLTAVHLTPRLNLTPNLNGNYSNIDT